MMKIKVFFFLIVSVLLSCKENIPPECTIVIPSGNAEFTQGDIINITVAADDPDGVISELRLFLNSNSLVTLFNFPYMYQINSDTLQPGTYSITAKATDNSGMEAEDEIQITIGPKPREVVISGFAQKGPFLNGSAVSVIELDDKLKQTGRSFTTQITDNAGSYKLSDILLESKYIELRVDGFYFDEIRGENSAGQFSLSALAEIEDSISVNINSLTHLEKGRTAYLMNTGLSFAESKKRAQEDVLSIFHIEKEDIRASEKLDISKYEDCHAVLLAISAILQQGRSLAEMTELMANIGTDIREDGVLDNQLIRSSLFNLARTIDTSEVWTFLDSRYQSLEVNADIPPFGKYVLLYIEKENPLKISGTVTDCSCNNFTNGRIDLIVEGGTEPYTYEWEPKGQNTKDIISIKAGDYTVHVTDANSFRSSVTFTVNEPSPLLIETETLLDALSGESGSIEITAEGGTPPYAYLWQDESTERMISDLSYGIYKVTVTDQNLCKIEKSFSIKGEIVDDRDNRTYLVVPIGEQVWMGENLAYLPSVNNLSQKSDTEARYYVYDYNGNIVAEAKATDNYNTYGALYNWSAAKTGCPSGWHLPTDSEWKELEIYLGMSKEEADLTYGRRVDNIGGKLKETGTEHWLSPNSGATDEWGFRALPTGYVFPEHALVHAMNHFCHLWTSTPYNSTKSMVRFLRNDEPSIGRFEQQKAMGMAVRCVKD